MGGFEDLDDDMDENITESMMRQQIFRNNSFIDDDEMDDDELLSWSGRHMGGDDSDEDDVDERMALGEEIRKSLSTAGIGTAKSSN